MSEYKAEQSKDMLEQQKDQDEQIKEVGSIPLENDSGKPNIQSSYNYWRNRRA